MTSTPATKAATAPADDTAAMMALCHRALDETQRAIIPTLSAPPPVRVDFTGAGMRASARMVAGLVAQHGCCVVDTNMPPNHLANAGHEARALFSRGKMRGPTDAERSADTGHNLWLHEYVRVTSGCGIDAVAAGAGTLGLIDKLLADFGRAIVDEVATIAASARGKGRRTAAETFACGTHGEVLHCTGRSDALLACYPGGKASYGAHLDNEAGTRDGRLDYGRCFTFVYYLNSPQWDAKRDGGGLRVFAPMESGPNSRALGSFDVLPVAGRVVIFRSDMIVHGVLPTERERVALTIWFYGGTREDVAKAAAGQDMMDYNSVVGQERYWSRRLRGRTGAM